MRDQNIHWHDIKEELPKPMTKVLIKLDNDDYKYLWQNWVADEKLYGISIPEDYYISDEFDNKAQVKEWSYIDE